MTNDSLNNIPTQRVCDWEGTVRLELLVNEGREGQFEHEFGTGQLRVELIRVITFDAKTKTLRSTLVLFHGLTKGADSASDFLKDL